MVGASEPFNEGLTVARELADIGLDIGGDAIDGNEERQLAMAQRVEDLSVVAARPHAVAIGDHSEPGDVFAGLHQRCDCSANAGQRKPGLEQRLDHAQRDEVTKGIGQCRVRGRGDEPDARPVFELCGGAPTQPRSLERSELSAHRPVRTGRRRVASVRASASRHRRTRPSARHLAMP